MSDKPIVAIPEVSSENRRYLPVDYLPPKTIISNKIYGAPDDGGLLFALASNSMFICWMKTVGGRLESRISFSSTITWNNFPVPELDDKTVNKLVKAGQGILEARAKFPDRSLADHHNSLSMDPDLIKAHDQLDRVMDVAMGAPVNSPSNANAKNFFSKTTER